MIRRVFVLTTAKTSNFTKKVNIRSGHSYRCQTNHITVRCLSNRPKNAGSVLTPSMGSPYTNQQEAVRHLLPDLLTSSGLTPKGRSLTLSEEQTSQFCSHYQQLDATARVDFLLALSELCGVYHEGVYQAAKKMGDTQVMDEPAILQSEQRLAQSLTPAYRLLFTHIGRRDDGVKFLVDMRADILMFLSEPNVCSNHHMRALSSTLKDMVVHWFSAGLLQLQTITWDSSCAMLQKISEYEAVHPVRGWADLKRRVGPYRRCFVFTHSSMPGEPVVVLHSALTDHIPSSIQSIVGERREAVHSDISMETNEPEDPDRITTAIFYSVSSTLKGLRGVDLGNYLIKQAVRTLRIEFPQLTVFSSLSPIPGFRSWLLAEISRHQRGERGSTALFTQEELGEIHRSSGSFDESEYLTVKRLLSTNQWAQSQTISDALERPLMRLCARYLYVEKHRKFALDAVANFHLRNGATMWRLNWMGDTSPRGLSGSCSMMVNYRYDLDRTLQLGQSYTRDQTISTTEQFTTLVEESRCIESKSNL